MRNTLCVCERGGWCQRHRCTKSDLMVRLCQCDPQFYDLWEEGCGPGQLVSLAPANAIRGDCCHLGAHVRDEPCLACERKVQIKIFACELHGECCFSKRLPTPRSCLDCADYQPCEGAPHLAD